MLSLYLLDLNLFQSMWHISKSAIRYGEVLATLVRMRTCFLTLLHVDFGQHMLIWEQARGE